MQPMVKSLFGFGSSTTIDVEFGDQASIQRVPVKDLSDLNSKVELPLFMNLDNITGVVHVKIRPGKKLEHQGIKIELIGQVELTQERGTPKYVFLSLLKELEQPGEMTNSKSYKFEFSHVEKQYESYRGRNARLRYFVRVKIPRQYATSITKEFDFAVQNIIEAPEINNSIKMEVGIEDCLHIEFEYDKDKYHLSDVVIGKIYFLLVRIKIKQMELQILRRETIGVGTNVHNDTEVLGKYEIMDGAPVRGECVPVRLFMEAYDLSPTMKDVYNKFSVRYFLNLVLIDEEDRRYFKQHEIQIWRQDRQSNTGVAAS